MICGLFTSHRNLMQLLATPRLPDFGSGGWGFESLPARHFILLSLLACLLVAGACGRAAETPELDVSPAVDIFVDRATELGIHFQHETGATGKLYIPEPIGSGVGVLDFDRDGDLDLYFVQAGSLDQRSELDDRLYRNDLARDDSWVFVDVTEATGLNAAGYGQGVAVGDVDNDGYPDLYLANLGQDQLLRNGGDGRFLPSPETCGPNDTGWATSAVFFDFDGDGYQDLYSTRYVQFSVSSHKECFSPTGERDYCKPGS